MKKEEMMYKGWNVVWHDWMDLPNQDALVGRWVGYSSNHDGPHLVSSWPGRTASFHNGQILDLSLIDGQVLPTRGHSREALALFKAECLNRLKRLIDKVGPPPLTSLSVDNPYDFPALVPPDIVEEEPDALLKMGGF